MSASQQKQNKKLHQLIDQLEDQIERIKTERNEFQQSAVDALGKVEDLQDEIKRLRGLIPQAWYAALEDDMKSLDEWMKQKGLE